jgi:hypothetical protein
MLLVACMTVELPLLCRFSDAGDDEADHRLEDRRLKTCTTAVI